MKIRQFVYFFVILCCANLIESTIPGFPSLSGGSRGGSSGSGALLGSLISGLAGRPGTDGDGEPASESSPSEGISDAIGTLFGVKRRLITSARDRSNTRYDSLLGRIDQFETFAPILTSLFQGGQQNTGNTENAEIPVDFGNEEPSSFGGEEVSDSFGGANGGEIGGNIGSDNGGDSISVTQDGFGGASNGFDNSFSTGGGAANSLTSNGGFQNAQNGFGNSYATGGGAANSLNNGGFVPSPVDPFAGQVVQSPEVVYGTPNGQVQVPDTVYGPPGYIPPPVVGSNYDITENEIRTGAANSLSLPSASGPTSRFSPNQISTQSTGNVIPNRPVTNGNSQGSGGVRTSSTGTRGSTTRNGGTNGGTNGGSSSRNGGSSTRNGGSTTRNGATNGGSADVSDALGTLLQVPGRAINVYRTRSNNAYNRLESMFNQFSRLLPTLVQGLVSPSSSRSGTNGSRRTSSAPASSSGGDLEFSPDVSRK